MIAFVLLAVLLEQIVFTVYTFLRVPSWLRYPSGVISYLEGAGRSLGGFLAFLDLKDIAVLAFPLLLTILFVAVQGAVVYRLIRSWQVGLVLIAVLVALNGIALVV